MLQRVYIETTFVSYLTARPSHDLIIAGHEITEEAVALAEELVRAGALPAKAGNDALHIAVTAVHRIPYLMTWNCRHMANATMRAQIEAVCASKGF